MPSKKASKKTNTGAGSLSPEAQTPKGLHRKLQGVEKQLAAIQSNIKALLSSLEKPAKPNTEKPKLSLGEMRSRARAKDNQNKNP